ncbi:hypothetical protein EV421DRAFT_1850324 [Armillaria borealis]|uniref:Uncharacterized protein n=1 Tax=Armillaria borealis TaxID=47425 RepID=A0AA39IX97_9AGAR|nr:hypothetical protein EV421DRAFT_1850324 [Armillaria borealis]
MVYYEQQLIAVPDPSCYERAVSIILSLKILRYGQSFGSVSPAMFSPWTVRIIRFHIDDHSSQLLLPRRIAIQVVVDSPSLYDPPRFISAHQGPYDTLKTNTMILYLGQTGCNIGFTATVDFILPFLAYCSIDCPSLVEVTTRFDNVALWNSVG